MTPWFRREAGHAWGPSHANQRTVLTLPWVQRALDSEYSHDAPLFSTPGVTYITLRSAFCRLLRHRIRHKGAGGVWRHAGGAWTWNPLPGKTPVLHPRTNWCRRFDAS